MKILNLIFFLSFLLLSFSATFGQSLYSVKGMVLDEKNNPLELVSVSLINNSDSNQSKSGFTELDGSYVVDNLQKGNYTLKLAYIGYENYVKDIVVNGPLSLIELEQVKLQQNGKQLKEVTVTGKVPYVERKLDRTIINVDALISNSGSNVLEALEKAPGVSVDQNGAIKLKGRGGVSVYIDDKPTYLSGSELESYLKSLSTDNIKRIEIMTNPPAKYEAAGNSGVINIITKRNKVSGLSGNAVLSLQQGRYTRSNNSLNLNYNSKKFSAYANMGGAFRNSFQDLNINRYYRNTDNVRTSSFSQNSFIVKDGRSANAKIGADYYMNDRSTFGISVKGLSSPSGDQTDNLAIIRNADNFESSRVLADNNTKSSFNNLAYNAYFRQQLDSLGSNLVVDADYVTYSTNGNQKFKNFVFDSLGTQTYQDQVNGTLP